MRIPCEILRLALLAQDDRMLGMTRDATDFTTGRAAEPAAQRFFYFLLLSSYTGSEPRPVRLPFLNMSKKTARIEMMRALNYIWLLWLLGSTVTAGSALNNLLKKAISFAKNPDFALISTVPVNSLPSPSF